DAGRSLVGCWALNVRCLGAQWAFAGRSMCDAWELHAHTLCALLGLSLGDQRSHLVRFAWAHLACALRVARVLVESMRRASWLVLWSYFVWRLLTLYQRLVMLGFPC